jgi:diguanylate cyclase (GGDEF)-like protein
MQIKMSKSAAHTPRPWLRRLGTLVTLGNLGITARLVVAFSAVAILAAASNLIIDNSVSLVHLVTSARTSSAAAELQAREAQRAAQARNRSSASASHLLASLANFDKAVRDHVEAGSPAAATRQAAVLAELERAADGFVRQLYPGDDSQAPNFREELRQHQKSASDLVRASQDSRASLARYSTTLSTMNAMLQKSIDSAWKIMGRVLARQSLMKLSAELDQIQNGFATRDVSGAASELGRLITAERAFTATLETNMAALRRSQGEQWLQGMRNGAAHLAAARVSFVQAGQRKARVAQAFARESARLGERIAEVLDIAHDGLDPQAAMTVRGSASAPALAQSPTSAPALEAAPNAHRAIVAWVSLFVLALLAYICAATILSVVRPVRRLLAATHQLAKDGTAAPVAPGGIHELDELGRAFNVMATRLAAAQASDHEAQRELERKVDERTRELQDLAERDPLTGLANRRKLFASLSSSIVEAREASVKVGAFVLDIDNFKTLNDSMGHTFGDRVLVAIARRLEQTVRIFGFAARLGGDEFMVVHEGAQSIAEIEASGALIVEAFHEPLLLGGRELIVSVSVGASVFPDHEEDAQALLRAADAALFSAKAQGRSRMAIFTPELLAAASAKFAIEQRLRRAVEKGEFELFYQPEVSVQTLEVSLVEALIRWRMPDGSHQCPGEFLAVAEESGLILEINDWVLRTAIATAAQWHRGPWPAARVAVNVSPRQFLDYRFVDRLQGLLAEYGLPARCLELELTESVLQTGPATIKALEQLRAIGVSIALDDFGTGYSSISSLEQLPLSRVKLDRSLIARMDSSARSASIARATVGLCVELGLQVTAEGVERLEQFSALLGYRSVSLQGFLLARPVPQDQLIALIQQVPAHCQELLLMSHSEPGKKMPVTAGSGRFRVQNH